MSRHAFLAVASSLVSLIGVVGACSRARLSPFGGADSNAYQLCENETQCPAGSYCQAGVCDADCLGDADCQAGQTCGSRGQCGADAAAPSFAGQLTVSSPSIDLAIGTQSASLRVENTGTAAIDHFHALSDDPAVTVTPSHGALPAGHGVDSLITVKSGWSGHATVRVLSSGGTSITSLTAHSGLAGYLRGSVVVTGPFLLGAADLALDLGTGLTGVVDGSASLLWPFNASVTAIDDGTNATLSFTLVGDPGSDGNLSDGAQVRREVRLSGTHQGRGALTGAYQEVVTGLGSSSVTVTGTFQLTPSGAGHGLIAQGLSSFRAPAAPRPFGESQCASPGCPDDLVARGNWYFGQAFPFEQWAEGSSIVNGLCSISSSLPAVPCLRPEQELPAIEAYQHSVAPADIWEVFRAEASEALLQANDVIARTIEPANAVYQGAAADAQSFQSALGLLQQGLHENAGVGGLLAAGNLWLAQKQPSAPSTLDLALDDRHRFGGIVRTELFAAAQRLDRLQRSGEPATVSSRAAQQQATAAFLDAAALATVSLDGTVQANAGPATLLDSAIQFASLAAAFDQVRRGLNAVGYPPGYIPFDYDPQQPTLDVFQQMAAVAGNQISTAAAIEAQLVQSDRDFESSSAALESAVEGVASQAQTQVVSLCGNGVDPSTGVGCGTQGKIGQDYAGMQAAGTAVQGAQLRTANDSQRLQMLEQQLQNEEDDQQDEMQAISSDGQTIALVAQAKAQEAIVNQDFACGTSALSLVGSIVQAFVEPFQAIASLFGGGANTVQQCEEAITDQTDAKLAWASAVAQNDETYQIQLGQNVVTDNGLLTQIFDSLADLGQSGVDTQQQMSLLTAAQTAVQTDFANLQQALNTAQSGDELQARNVDPTFRLYADQTGVQFAQQLAVARTWTFLATRALEYVLNETFANEGEVFAAADASDLTTYLAQLASAYSAQQLAGQAQDLDDFVSLRNDILGFTTDVKDSVTGQLLTPAQQFQAFLRLPKNLDAQGNLALAFNTEAASGGGPLFNPDVCEDRIADIKANLVSSSLSGATAYVGLTQKGQSTLVVCGPAGSTGYNLSTKTALITAGLNLPRSAENDPSYPANTDLFERPVLASSWVLSIDLHGDPANGWVDLSKLDDIELWVHHRALSVQE